MKWIKLSLGFLAFIGIVLIGYFVLKSHHALIVHPKGSIAQAELHLMIKNILLMLVIVFPTMILFYAIAWRYRAKNEKSKYTPDKTGSIFGELVLWIIPTAIIAIMAPITWKMTHKLDPYRSIEGAKPLTIQVVALDWKWLFIYPEQGIATVNFIQFPEKTPIHLELTADNAPMNSFWIPQLSGQIYTMPGMTTQLHLIADGPGIYPGRAAEINGDGLADMTFVAKSSSMADFESWVESVKKSPLQLDEQTYTQLLKQSLNNPVTLYSHVEKELFNKILMKYME